MVVGLLYNLRIKYNFFFFLEKYEVAWNVRIAKLVSQLHIELLFTAAHTVLSTNARENNNSHKQADCMGKQPV